MQHRVSAQRCVHCANVLHKHDIEAHPYRCFREAKVMRAPTFCGHCGARLIRGKCLVHFNFTAEYAKVYRVIPIAVGRTSAHTLQFSEERVTAMPLAGPPIAILVSEISSEELCNLIIAVAEPIIGVERGSLKRRQRARKYANGRRLVCWMMRKYHPRVGTELMGKVLCRNHTSIIRMLRDFQPEESEMWRGRIERVGVELHRKLLERRTALEAIRKEISESA